MHPRVRHRLLFGPYATPSFKLGQTVEDEIRGEVKIVGITAGRIPWPIGKRGRARAIVFYGSLVEAARRESSPAIRYWWGVGHSTAAKWRTAGGLWLDKGSQSESADKQAEWRQFWLFARMQLAAHDDEQSQRLGYAARVLSKFAKDAKH